MNVLYQENDWVYVIGEDQREGFIPHSYCAPYTPHLGEMTIKKKLPRDLNVSSDTLSNAGTLAGPNGPGGGPGGGNNPETATQLNTTLNSTRKFSFR